VRKKSTLAPRRVQQAFRFQLLPHHTHPHRTTSIVIGSNNNNNNNKMQNNNDIKNGLIKILRQTKTLKFSKKKKSKKSSCLTQTHTNICNALLFNHHKKKIKTTHPQPSSSSGCDSKCRDALIRPRRRRTCPLVRRTRGCGCHAGTGRREVRIKRS
jgi:hypothetical protein